MFIVHLPVVVVVVVVVVALVDGGSDGSTSPPDHRCAAGDRSTHLRTPPWRSPRKMIVEGSHQRTGRQEDIQPRVCLHFYFYVSQP